VSKFVRDFARQAPWLETLPYRPGAPDGSRTCAKNRGLAPDITARPVTHAVMVEGGGRMYFCCEDPNGLLTYSLTREEAWSREVGQALDGGGGMVKEYGKGPHHPVGTFAAKGHVSVEVCPYARMAAHGFDKGEVLLKSDRALARGMAVAKSSLEAIAAKHGDLGPFCGFDGGSMAWRADATGSEIRLLMAPARSEADGGPHYLPCVNMDALCRRWFPPSGEGYNDQWGLGKRDYRPSESFQRLFGHGWDLDLHDPWVSCDPAHNVWLEGSTMVGGKPLPAMKLVADRLAADYMPVERPLAAHAAGRGLEVYTRSSKSWVAHGAAFAKPNKSVRLENARKVLGEHTVNELVRELVEGCGDVDGVVLLGDAAATRRKMAEWNNERKLKDL
jgi:hypothetical protein